MGAERAIQKARANQHKHALERLRERYWPDASHADLIQIRDLAAEMAKSITPLPGADTKQMFVKYAGRLVHVVYCPRFRAIRTVLP